MMELFRAAGSVCRSWRKVVKEEPDLWRKIDLTKHAYGLHYRAQSKLMDLMRIAIDRSGGRLEDFSGYLVDGDMLQYLSDRTSVLKRLRLISCLRLSEKAIVEAVKRQPLLEEIQITFTYVSFTEKVTEIVGEECPQLKIFKFNNEYYPTHPPDSDDELEGIADDHEALGIAKTMHQLRHLQLIGNRLTNEGTKAILDGCPHLETLDLRRCYNVNMNTKLWADCARLKIIRLPGDSVDDYEFKVDVEKEECFPYVGEYYDDVADEIDDEIDYYYENLFAAYDDQEAYMF